MQVEQQRNQQVIIIKRNKLQQQDSLAFLQRNHKAMNYLSEALLGKVIGQIKNQLPRSIYAYKYGCSCTATLKRWAHRQKLELWAAVTAVPPQRFSLLTESHHSHSGASKSSSLFRPRKRIVQLQPSQARRFELLCPQQLPLKLQEQNARHDDLGQGYMLHLVNTQKTHVRCVLCVPNSFNYIESRLQIGTHQTWFIKQQLKSTPIDETNHLNSG